MQAHGNLTATRLTNSTNGNPRYSVCLERVGGSVINGVTRSDSSFCYTMPTSGPVLAEWHRTRTGRIVFDDIVRCEAST